MPNAIGDIWQMRIVCVCGKQTSFNVRHYAAFNQTGVGANQDQVAVALGVNLGITVRACISDVATYNGIDVKKIFPGDATAPTAYTLTAGDGANTSPPLPLQVSGLISFYTGLAGRKQRGRVYIPFPPVAANQEPNGPTPAYVAALGTLRDALSNTVLAGNAPDTTTLVPILWHRKTNTYNTALTWLPRAAFATQRKRGDYGRENKPPF